MGASLFGDVPSGLDDRVERLERPAVITITTDFGQYDGYVGTMKGVIYTLLPSAVIVDISHEITAQAIQEGAFILYRAYRYFPATTVHLAIVDPGVGSARRPIALVTRHGTFVGPDNGIFTYLLRAEETAVPGPIQDGAPAWAGGMWGIAPHWANESSSEMLSSLGSDEYQDEDLSGDSLPRAYHLTNPDFWLAGVSSTFHGRDIFAPVAAHIASGAHPDRMGERIPLSSLVMLPYVQPRVTGSGRDTTVTGQVVHVDRFGNIITNLPDILLSPLLEDSTSAPVVEIAGHHIFGLAHSYADVREGQPLALMGSEGLLEVAVRNSNAALRMKTRIGDPVRVIINRLEPR